MHCLGPKQQLTLNADSLLVIANLANRLQKVLGTVVGIAAGHCASQEMLGLWSAFAEHLLQCAQQRLDRGDLEASHEVGKDVMLKTKKTVCHKFLAP